MGSKTVFAIVVVAQLLISASVWAVPDTINYQGKLTNLDGGLLTGTYGMRFYLCDGPAEGTCNWSEEQHVEVKDGIFNVLLGNTAPIPTSIFETDFLCLEVHIYTGSEWEVLTPRQSITSVAFARKAEDAVTLEGAHASDLEESAEIDADIAAHAVLPNAHHAKTTSFTELVDSASDAQIPAAIARDNEIMPTVLNNDGAGSGLDADLLDGQQATAFAAAGHNHLGEMWNLGTNSTGLVLVGSVSWGNSLIQAFNHSNGPSIWGMNDGGGNAVRGQGGGTSLGVYGQAENAAGVMGRSSGDDGVAGISSATDGSGVYGYHEGNGPGVVGKSNNGLGVYGQDAGPNPDDSWAVWADGDMRTTGDLTVGQTLYVGGYATFQGGKSGFVVDIAQNDDTVPLMPGDVVSISGAGPAVVGEIPVIKVRRATTTTATGVIGVVDGRFTLTARVSAFSIDGTAQEKIENRFEATSVEPGQYLTVVTLGAYKVIKVDTSRGSISPGDLLVASSKPGYAIRSVEPLHGTIIGKSLGSLSEGTGVVPVLVTLQ